MFEARTGHGVVQGVSNRLASRDQRGPGAAGGGPATKDATESAETGHPERPQRQAPIAPCYIRPTGWFT